MKSKHTLITTYINEHNWMQYGICPFSSSFTISSIQVAVWVEMIALYMILLNMQINVDKNKAEVEFIFVNNKPQDYQQLSCKQNEAKMVWVVERLVCNDDHG
jgi:hypothetical protein